MESVRLTPKERRVLELIADGWTSQQIAEDLCLSLPTIKWYRGRLRSRLGASSSVQMIKKAIELKLI